jgi:putative MATE family efflux protein
MKSAVISYKRIWHIAYPIILGSVAQNVVNFTDTAFLGRVSEVALGAGALGGLFYLAIFMLGLGFGTGAQIIIARRIGEGKTKEVGLIMDHALLFMLFLALGSFILMFFGGKQLLFLSIKSENVYRATVDFMNYRSFGIFFAFINVTFRSFYVGITKTKVITYTTLVMASTNITLDYLLIFGNFGLPEMGIKGAALASTIAEGVAMIFFISYTFRTVNFAQYNLFRFKILSPDYMIRILKVSLPVMMQQFASLSVWFIFFLIIEKLGEASLAVSNIIRSIYVILMIPVWGFATATNTLVSKAIGEGNEKEVMKIVYKIAGMTFTGVLIIILAGIAFPRLVMEVYTNDTILIEMGKKVLYVVSIGALFISIGFIIFNGVSGTGKTNISLSIELTVLAVYLVYTFILINYLHANVVEVWTAELIYGSLLTLFSWVYLKSGKWKGKSV